MSDCLEEHQTRHYRGRRYGFGPVHDGERILFAVFQSTKRDGFQLVQGSFDNQNLSKNSQSVARLGYVTKSLFYRKIADQLTKGALVGVSWANVSNIRALRADVKLNKGVAKVRAICVLDRVDEGDVEGHATMGFAEGTTRNVNQGQIGTISMKIRLDLANAFSSIVPTDSQPWPWAFLMPLKRIASIVRELFALVRLK